MAMAAALARRRLFRLLASSPNPKPLSLSSSSSSFDAPATARRHDPDREGDLLRLRSMGSVAAALDGWTQSRVRISRTDLQRAFSQLRRARRYEHGLERVLARSVRTATPEEHLRCDSAASNVAQLKQGLYASELHEANLQAYMEDSSDEE